MKRFIVGTMVIALHFVAFAASAATTATEPHVVAQAEHAKAPIGEKSGRYDREKAQMVIEAHGYEHVLGLAQGAAGVWRGTAVRYGKIADVEVDQKGNFYD